jgi:endonuclease YncB( thermonuclease family)
VLRSKILLYITFIIIFFIFTSAFADEIYTAKIERVIDGDTVEIIVPCLPKSVQHMKVRLKNIDTPELHAQCTQEKQKAEIAKSYVKSTLEHKIVELKNCTADKYFRLNCEIVYDSVKNISSDLTNNGFAVPYFGDKKTHNWCTP